MKVILRADEIPVGATVTKCRGSKEYILRDSIRIFYKADRPATEIKAEGGARFLVNDNGDINAVDASLELVWHVDEGDLFEFLRNVVEGGDQ